MESFEFTNNERVFGFFVWFGYKINFAKEEEVSLDYLKKNLYLVW